MIKTATDRIKVIPRKLTPVEIAKAQESTSEYDSEYFRHTEAVIEEYRCKQTPSLADVIGDSGLYTLPTLITDRARRLVLEKL